MFPVSGASSFALAHIEPNCPALPLLHSAQCYPGESARDKKLPLEGGTSNTRSQFTKIYQQVYNPVTYKALNGSTRVDDSVAERFETVINYLPNFKIALSATSVARGSGSIAYGVFNALTRKIRVWLGPERPVDRKYVSLAVRHEMIHASVNTQNNYLKDANPYSSNPYSTSKEKEALRTAIKTGIERTNKFIKNSQQRDANIVNWLKYICEQYKETYDFTSVEGWSNLRSSINKTFERNKLPLFDTRTPLNSYGKATIKLSKINQSTEHVFIITESPVDALLATLYLTPIKVKTSYNDDRNYFNEFEAYLFSMVPKPVMKHFFPEYVQLIDARANLFWQRRPEAAFAALHLPTYENEDEEIQHEFSLLQGDPRFLKASIPDNAKLAANCEVLKQNVLAPGQDANRARYFAHNMLKIPTANAQLKKAAHDLLRHLEQLPNDGLQVCRSANPERHPIYRKANLFTVNDYVFCIDSLLAQNKKEEAKVICKKALAIFPHEPQLAQRVQRLGVKKKHS